MSDKAMSNLGYERIADDAYFTIEEWCTEALFETFKDKPDYSLDGTIWEPACGAGLMANVINRYNEFVICTDLNNWGYGDVEDFMHASPRGDHIVTNPPYEKKDCEGFIRRAVDMLTDGSIQSVSMLLRNEWDSGINRADLFRDNPYWSAKVVLLKRPRWFERREGDASPRHNYAWYHWRANNTGNASIFYYHPSK